jgi:hypothetical protein
MKERLYLTPDARAWLEVCDCKGELQIRLRGEPMLESIPFPSNTRVRLTAATLVRIAEFIQGVAEELEIVERERNT